MSLPPNKTKVVCTIGPASSSREVMKELLQTGMDVARLNLSHGDLSEHARTIGDLRLSARAAGRRLAIMADLPGPKIRIGQFAEEPVELKIGDRFTLTTEEIVGDPTRVSVTFPGLPQAVGPGDRLYLNDGFIQLQVERVKGKDVRCRVLVGGELRSRKGLNLPGIDLGIGAFTENDHRCLTFAREQGLDAVSQSFVESAADVDAVRRAAEELGFHPFIIAKIERAGALEHMEEILQAADGIMIARGDLGVEIPIERIAVVQKRLMREANLRAKPVITATQMLESMTDNPRPTRAEATDVANAILDGTDCVMLSAESAMGKYPVDAVAMLVRIASATEAQREGPNVRALLKGADLKERVRPADLIALSVETALEHSSPAAVFVPTYSGASARNIGRFRLPVWIVGVSGQEATCQGLQFSYGVFPVHEPDPPEEWNAYARHWLGTRGIAGDLVVLTEGPSPKRPDANHRLEILDLSRSAGA